MVWNYWYIDGLKFCLMLCFSICMLHLDSWTSSPFISYELICTNWQQKCTKLNNCNLQNILIVNFSCLCNLSDLIDSWFSYQKCFSKQNICIITTTKIVNVRECSTCESLKQKKTQNHHLKPLWAFYRLKMATRWLTVVSCITLLLLFHNEKWWRGDAVRSYWKMPLVIKSRLR